MQCVASQFKRIEFISPEVSLVFIHKRIVLNQLSLLQFLKNSSGQLDTECIKNKIKEVSFSPFINLVRSDQENSTTIIKGGRDSRKKTGGGGGK